MIDKKPKLPLYAKEVYGRLYNNPTLCRFLDKPKLLWALTFGASKKLIESSLKEIKLNDRVLQVGVTFGDQIERTAEKVGFYGRYDVLDVHRGQLEYVEDKYRYLYPKMGFILQDATTKIDGEYDVILCYMLLHEVPIFTKTKIVNNLLSAIGERGRVVFVDYHQPSFWHPLRYVVRMFNRLYQPFAEKLWDRDIVSFAKEENRMKFAWRKNTFFGKMYQKVVAVKKDN